MDDRIRQIIGSQKNKESVNADTNINVSLDSKERLLKINANQITRIVSEQDQYALERDSSWLYRLSGRLNLITSNQLSPDACDDVWEPITTSYQGITSANNWVLQLCYPSKKDYDYKMWDNTHSVRYGMLVDTITNSEEENGRVRVVVKTKQKHSLSKGDYVHINCVSSNNLYQGIHKIERLGGENGEDQEFSFTLETTFNGTNGGYIFIKRVTNVSDDDFNNQRRKTLNTLSYTDIDGNSGVNSHITITTPEAHGLGINGFIDLNKPTGSIWNGTHRVVNVISPTKFVIESVSNTAPTGLSTFTWRRFDGTPSEYYVREFTIVSLNDYEVYPAGFSSSIYTETSDHTIGTANGTWLFHFNNDINLAKLISHKDGFVDELYLCMMKRAGEQTYNFTKVTSHWDFKAKEATTSNGIQTISNYTQGGLGTIKNGSYIGDVVEYNRFEILEKTISKVNFRFSVNNEGRDDNGYYYDPFRKLNTRVFSINREIYPDKDGIEGVSSNYEIYPDNSIGWRDLLSNGVFEEGTNGVDHPFINNRHYLYDNFYFYIRQQKPLPESVIDQSGITTIDTNFNC